MHQHHIGLSFLEHRFDGGEDVVDDVDGKDVEDVEDEDVVDDDESNKKKECKKVF